MKSRSRIAVLKSTMREDNEDCFEKWNRFRDKDFWFPKDDSEED